ncbi:MAG: DUF3047 domain-containing protein [Deltaproteobacteria bacterium]|nr:DUF3047 domain-containing protein [Deltaproteobacteria bacterium]
MKKAIWGAVAAFLLVWSIPGIAENPIFRVGRFDIVKMAEGAPEGWTLEVKEGEPAVRYEKSGDLSCLYFNAQNSSFGIKKSFELDLREYPFLNWKWKVSKVPEKGDFQKKETDDQAAQLYVLFPRFPAKLNTDFVAYYWDSNPRNKGREGTSVVWSKCKIIVLQAGKERLNQWMSEKRNVYEDYKKLFGKEPPNVGGVAFYINSQRTRSEAEAYLHEIYFSKK